MKFWAKPDYHQNEDTNSGLDSVFVVQNNRLSNFFHTQVFVTNSGQRNCVTDPKASLMDAKFTLCTHFLVIMCLFSIK